MGKATQLLERSMKFFPEENFSRSHESSEGGLDVRPFLEQLIPFVASLLSKAYDHCSMSSRRGLPDWSVLARQLYKVRVLFKSTLEGVCEEADLDPFECFVKEGLL